MLLPAVALAMLNSLQNPAADAQVISGLQDFSRDLIKALPTERGQNLVASPFSVSQCLALLLPGVGKADGAMIAKRLHLPASASDAAEGIHNLNARLSNSPNGEVVVANSLWTGPGYRLTATHKNAVEQQFGAEAFSLPSTGAPGVQAVNAWIKAKTKGRIPSLLEQLSAATSAVLVNAVSFDAKWQTPFKTGLTANRPFRVPSREMRVPTMAAKYRMEYGKGAGFQLVRLSYASGSYAMLVMLPEPGRDPVDLLKTLNLSDLPPLAVTYVDLQIPKFKFSSRLDLMGSLQALGLASLAKRFDAMPMLGTSRPMKLSQLLHGAEIEVDENGTRAAAATVAGVTATAIMRQPEPVVFHVDRPFAFVILHGPTWAPLFEGAVYEPNRGR